MDSDNMDGMEDIFDNDVYSVVDEGDEFDPDDELTNEEIDDELTNEEIDDEVHGGRQKDISAIDYVNMIIASNNFMNTKGSIFLRNGMVVKIFDFFDYFKEMWNEYKRLVETGEEEEMEEFFSKKTNGGVISNGDVDLDLDEVVMMIKDSQELRKKMKDNRGNKEKE